MSPASLNPQGGSFALRLVMSSPGVVEAAAAVAAAAEGSFYDSWLFDAAIVIVAFLGGAYWYFRKSKPQTNYEFTPITTGGGLTRRLSEGGFIAKLKNHGRNVVVFYGSQTGTAEDLASRIAKDSTRYGMKGIALDPEECEMEDLPQLAEIQNSLAIFCVATYGEGDPTDNAQEFYEYLQRGDADLKGVHYAVFGLGNKTYEHYNSMGKYVDKRLEELGATRVYQLGLGDDDGNLEEDFMVWREGFWPAVCESFDITTVSDDINTRQYRLTMHDQYDSERVFTGEVARLKSYQNQRPPYDAKNPYLAPVKVNDKLNQGGDRIFLHIEFDISESRIRYEAGDHLAVYPTNDPDLVEQIGRVLHVDLDQVFTLTNVDEDSSKRHPFPCPCSYRTALLHYVDITTPPRTNVLKELAQYCKEQEDKDWFLSMVSAKDESRKMYNDKINVEHRTVLDVLQERKSCKPPVDHLLEMLPRMQPRYYSISSSPKADPTVVSITIVVLRYKSKIGKEVHGVATNWLALKKPDHTEHMHPRVPIFVRKSQVRLPHQPKTPVIMVGPGTGLAPFRGFIQDRFHQKKDGKEVGPTVLFYGCRRKDEDYLYKQALEKWLGDGTLAALHVAFSRDQEQKVYVQHMLKQAEDKIWELIQGGAHIYVCGDARNMARDVHGTFERIAVEKGGMSEEDAVKFIKKMESQKRYQADVWS